MRKKQRVIIQEPIILKRAFDIRVQRCTRFDTWLAKLRHRKIKVTSKVKDVLDNRGALSASAEDLVLATVSVQQLGLPDGAQLGQILYVGTGAPVIWDGKDHYLEPVRAVDVLEFRLIYLDQPRNEWLRAAMEGFRHPMGNNVILRVVHGSDGVLYLDSDDDGDADDRFDDHATFIWCLRSTTRAKGYLRKVVVPKDLEHPHD